MLRLLPSALLAMLLTPAVGLGHYPWFLADSSADKKGTVAFVFEDGLAPGDGQYLEPFIKNAKYWLRTADKKEAVPLPFEEVKKDGKRWLRFSPRTGPSRSIDCYCKWGVYQGNLLHYYARHLDVTSADHLAVLGRAEKLRFDLVPRVNNGMMEFQVLWAGKPAAGKTVSIAGPQFKATAKSDAQGIVRFKPREAGLYSLRTQFIEPEPAGTDDGKAYKGLRQTATITITLPIPGAAAGTD